MEHEIGGAKFRLPNAQLTEELQRMDELWADLATAQRMARSAASGSRTTHFS
jgi:hypothetical protein